MRETLDFIVNMIYNINVPGEWYNCISQIQKFIRNQGEILMWTRSLLKQNAWSKLKNYYWPALGVTVVAAFMGANTNFLPSGGGGGGTGSMNQEDLQQITENSDMSSAEMIGIAVGILAIVLIAWIISILWATFLGAPTRCGECKYFVSAAQGDQKFDHLFDNFRNGNYKPTIKVMFFRNLYILGWYMLLIIPGLVKMYEYFLIPYLLAENPNIGKDRAFEISKKTMDGEKMNLFVLDLSFIGWYILGLCACCIGIYAVIPYYEATMAEFYLCMRAKMISYGITTEEELTGGLNSFDAGFDPYNTGADANGTFTDASSNPYTSAPQQNDFGGSAYNNPVPEAPASTEMPDVPEMPDADSFDNPPAFDEPDDSNPYNDNMPY